LNSSEATPIPLEAASLIEWFQERPFWIQEATRRLLTKDNLSDMDLRELSTICEEQARQSENATAPAALPKSAFAQKTDGLALRLNAISDVVGVDALNPRSPLTFSQEPLTIVYGGTAVGKSGYIRILNNICGSKNRRKLLGNVFTGTAPQGCKISYLFNGKEKDIAWQPRDGLQPELASVEVYDSECGQVYVNAENEVTYEPWLLGIFQRLVEACGAIDQILERKIAELPSKTPALPVELSASLAGHWYAHLSALTTNSEITQWCEWSLSANEALEGLYGRVIEKNPIDRARRLRSRKQALEALSIELTRIVEGLNDPTAAELFSARDDAIAKRKTASEDARKVFEKAPLNGVGQASWKLLWEQARAYSEGVAYLAQQFPVTDESARCVLCHQLLDDTAKTRLISFEAFVKGELESVAKEAETKFASIVNQLPTVPTRENFRVRIASLGLNDDNSIQKLNEFRDEAEARRDALVAVTTAEKLSSIPNLALFDNLQVLATALEVKAKEFDDDAKDTAKIALRSQVREFEARKWLSEQKTSIDDEILRLKKIAVLGGARRLTTTTGLSRKKAELAQMLVSDAFIGRFNSELNALSADRIQVELVQSRTDKGHVFHRILLKNAKLIVPSSEVLSEGERRVVSLAAFLADIEGIEANTPVVLDDPVTSLDQDFEESVVARLVALAEKHQVIVFTHRLSLLTLLEDAAKVANVNSETMALSREPWGTGEPGETPFAARKPDKVINSLLNERLARARKILAANGKAEYDAYAKGICSDARILVERLVEDILLNDVVRRFRRAVHTQNKIGGLARIKPEDCQMIDELMTKYSRYEHSHSREAPVELPGPDEIATDLTRLQTWLKEFSQRKIPSPMANLGQGSKQ
jgi:energy-coupling factor transporter ATP-binding protein EcfA2